ncbi:MAG: B12-binding domain-containing radical SAM protein, partial [Desulfatitalea sp.]|nr:B12-binding domain-containing radical SAM protein [Desulfatitalea sp.]NNK02787.1 B12-binding domain-containing radical SAM protein [Desulfatitalea sp.]
MVLAFPDLYDIGTSHFGIQILYHLLNQRTDCYAERVFCPAADYEAQLREHRLALCSLETQTPLKQFDIIGFSLLYELNFTNVLHMLNMSGLALRSKDRSTKDPVIIAGGPCVSNPEPMAPFFDAMVFGDGETVLPRMAEQYMAWKRKGGHHKTKLLQSWAESGHVYVPSFFEAKFDDHGF